MNARDIMTDVVIAATPETSVQDVAKLLLDKRISAVPVVDRDGTPVGIVSEGDLLGRDETAREARRDWWLELLAEGEVLHPDYLATLRTPVRRARDVMSAPLVTIGEDTEVGEIAQLLAAHRIKRLPVVRHGRIVGIVSRADLLHTLLQPAAVGSRTGHSRWRDLFASLDQRFSHGDDAAMRPAARPAGRPEDTTPQAAEFRGLVSASKRHEREEQATLQQAAAERRRELVVELSAGHVSDDRWRTLLHQARDAAEHGQKQMLLLRFPCDLCGDGGRAINVSEPGWPSTLRGEAAEIYLRWEQELKPHGFHLSASVLEFPDGKPGDIGLFLAWAA